MNFEDKMVFCRGLLSETINIIDHLEKKQEIIADYYSWIKKLVEFVEKECSQDPALRQEIDRTDFAALKELYRPDDPQAASKALIGGVKHITFMMDYFNKKQSQES